MPVADPRADLGAAVRRLLAARVRAADGLAALPDDAWLGGEAVGLDSVATVELLLACEAEFGVSLPTVLLSGLPLTLGRLTRAIADAREGPTDTSTAR
jgi:acyl carrier protein